MFWLNFRFWQALRSLSVIIILLVIGPISLWWQLPVLLWLFWLWLSQEVDGGWLVALSLWCGFQIAPFYHWSFGAMMLLVLAATLALEKFLSLRQYWWSWLGIGGVGGGITAVLLTSTDRLERLGMNLLVIAVVVPILSIAVRRHYA